ncbi:hypothetical protein [Mycobacterium sp. OTB74]|jgi:hypothetical protein|uniref:hypothetical protein n=1 Tax=Mycobacterium sp. OTB74 TaxID=1853452 RepID=UPI002474B2E2|nr:hypothetical protein [Mycobacterium sp. OTB74]MDH6246673.1 hypothetical protein [Mycobacterium sp. OTB74]
MARHRRQIFWGTLSSDTEDFLLQLPLGSPELVDIGANSMKVDLFVQPGIEEVVVDSGLDQHQEVSILGHLGVDPRLGPGDHILAERIASHDDIAARAFEIYQSGRGQSAFDNWLSAESQLLGV